MNKFIIKYIGFIVLSIALIFMGFGIWWYSSMLWTKKIYQNDFHQYDKLINYLIKIDSSRVNEVIIKRAQYYFKNKQYNKSIDDFDIVLINDIEMNKYQSATYHYGYAFQSLGQIDRSLEIYKVSANFDGVDFWTRINRVHIYIQRKEFKKGLLDIEYLSKKYPNEQKYYHSNSIIIRKELNK